MTPTGTNRLAPGKIPSPKPSLNQLYPVNSIQELKLSTGGEIVSGLVYCTDETSNSVVLKKSLPHTTLSSDIRIINASSILESKVIADEAPLNRTGADVADTAAVELAVPLSLNLTKKSVEEKERRAMKISEDSLRHINEKASPGGQAVFDRLLKACNEVVWDDGESILVLNNIRVDPPYTVNECKLMQHGDNALNVSSLERVKRIVRGEGCF